MALWIVGVIGALLVVAALLVVRPDADRAKVLRAYTMPDSQFLTMRDGGVAHVRIEGPADAPAMVLLHGFASSAWAWDGWARALSADYRVIRIDLPGHGLTAAPRGGIASRPGQAAFVGEVMDALGVRTAIIGGNSMGGAIAWSFAATHPERVSALILVDSAGPSRNGPPRRVGAILRAWYAPLLKAAFRWGGGTLIMRQSLHAGVADPRVVSDADVRRTDLFWRLHRGDLLASFDSIESSAPPSLDAIRAPTLVLYGGRDRLVSRAQAEALVAGIRGAQLIEYPALGHTPHQEAPAQTAADVRAFLEQVGGR